MKFENASHLFLQLQLFLLPLKEGGYFSLLVLQESPLLNVELLFSLEQYITHYPPLYLPAIHNPLFSAYSNKEPYLSPLSYPAIENSFLCLQQ